MDRGGNMHLINMAAVCVYACILGAGLPGAACAQAFVNQATPPNGGSVYVDQVPLNAKPRAPQAQQRNRSAQESRLKTRASVVGKVATVAQNFPTIGSGSSAVIRPGGIRDWPSVGNGTVRR